MRQNSKQPNLSASRVPRGGIQVHSGRVRRICRFLIFIVALNSAMPVSIVLAACLTFFDRLSIFL